MYIVVFITAANKKEADKIAKRLVEQKLVACVNIIDKVKSVFWWEKKINGSKEVLLILKSKKARFNKIVRLVKFLHSYEVPEIIALPIIAGEKKYLRWLDDSIR